MIATALALLLAQVTPAPQTTPMAKLPPANPLPYADADAEAVMAPISRLFAALTARDGQALLANVREEGGVTAVVEGPQAGVRQRRWSDFAAALATGTQRLEERQGTPAIEVDGDIAMVWAPYVFLVDGKIDHCGTNHFDLVREGGSWKVLNATYTHRTTGCEAQ